jgi:hypothetical protein
MVWIHAMPHQHGPADMTKKRWIAEGLSCTKFYGYCLEDAPYGIRKPNTKNFGRPTIKHMHFDGNGVDMVFSNCLACSKKDFSGSYKSPAHGRVSIDYKDSPRLGRCGCVVCTECYLEVKKDYEDNEEWIRCPNLSCRSEESACSHHRDEVIWILNEAAIINLTPKESVKKENIVPEKVNSKALAKNENTTK